MAKLSKISDDVQEMVDRLVEETGLYNYLNIKCLNISSQKQIVKVARANATTEYLGQCPDTVVLYIVEEILLGLTPEQQKMLLRDALAQVFFDTEKDKITIFQPEINVTLGGYQKYGKDLIEAQEAAILYKKQLEDAKKNS